MPPRLRRSCRLNCVVACACSLTTLLLSRQNVRPLSPTGPRWISLPMAARSYRHRHVARHSTAHDGDQLLTCACPAVVRTVRQCRTSSPEGCAFGQLTDPPPPPDRRSLPLVMAQEYDRTGIPQRSVDGVKFSGCMVGCGWALLWEGGVDQTGASCSEACDDSACNHHHTNHCSGNHAGTPGPVSARVRRPATDWPATTAP